MHKGRVEAFSDGVIAILITIMVLELRVPPGDDWSLLWSMKSIFLSYALSFVFLAIYWNNHHHLFQAVAHVNGRILWANAHLLFWLSLIPFATWWMGDNKFSARPVMAYGVVLLMCAIAYTILVRVLLAHHGKDSLIGKAIGSDLKGNISLACYVLAILIALFQPMVACALYVVVAVMWLVPDRRFERVLGEGTRD